ncbi:NAD-dependent epimerase/dehydratase family protein [Urechidicola vernalis]|uniref:NAD-dependent epimerase/dehydratase family protein n=1 Tax=Urechidicola vernalis TaxID=3075600 RepID=A0ABU2Y628_9FLAO|nr:NAD-dependent epimerase/dehydratase family protein [Urechidicola sp. P050]MDT0553659.1 NAD-dependent epimerase/dehydratase family protein [Urechidicola sp. P050]
MILVTGGTGLVGAHLLVKLTQEKLPIRAIHRSSSNLDAVKKVFFYYFKKVDSYFDKIEWVVADITDTTSLEPVFKDVEFVYHCAAMISFHPKKYRSMRNINIEGTANIVNFSIVQGIKKLCYVSSIAAVGKPTINGLIDESTEWNVETSNYGYAITKHGAEMEVWRGTQEGLDAVIVNPGIILGEGFYNQGSGKLFSKVKKGLKHYTNGTTGYVDVQDVIDIMIQLLNSSIVNERYILIAENRSFKEVFTQIANGFNLKPPSKLVSVFMTEIGWRLALVMSFLTGREPMLTKNSAKSIHKKSEFSNAKILKALDYNFKSVEESVKRICDNF